MECLSDVLGADPDELDADASLTSLGLESFAAVRLRRRLRADLDLDLPLTAFLGAATARTLAAGVVLDEEAGAVALPSDALEKVPAVDLVGDPDDESFPLTPIQAAYLVGRDPAFPLGGVGTFYYHEFDREPAGDPREDVESLSQAWNQLMHRHPMLRMTVGPDARQRILPDVPGYRIATEDLRHHDDATAARRLADLRHECSHQLRPVDAWPMFDIRAALLPDGRTRIFLGVDVLALDLHSWLLLMREWGALSADPEAQLPVLTDTFADLQARRRADVQAQQRRSADAAWWSGRMAELPSGPALPWTRPIAEMGVPRVTRHTGRLSAAAWKQLRAEAGRRGLSPTGLLLAAYALVLRRWGAAEPFCLNTTLFDRPVDEDEPTGSGSVVGDFTTTVLVEVGAIGWSDFVSFATALNQRFWTDLDHRAVSAVEVLPRNHDAESGLPVPRHPVVFTSGVGLSDAPATDWLGTQVFGVSQSPQVLIDHIVTDAGGALEVCWDVCDGALPDGFAEGMRDAHTQLLRQLATDESAWSDPQLSVDPTFLPQSPVPADAFDDSGPLLDDPFRAAAQRRPDAPALLGASGPVTAGVLARRSTATGRALAALGLGPGDLVGVSAQKGSPLVTALLGVSASGAGYVPVEPEWPAARVESVCARADLRHALVGPGADPGQWPESVTVHQLDENGVLVPPEGDPGDEAVLRAAEPADLAYAIFTSGSTGTPKGVAIEHQAARTTLDDLDERFPLRPDDRVLALSAASFDLSVWDIYALLGRGGALVLPEPAHTRDPEHWLELMGRHRVTVWNTAPALMEMLVEYAELETETARKALSTLRLVFLSGDWVPVTLPDRIRALAPQALVVSLGGATEASIWSICYPIGDVDPAWPSIPYGRALRGQRIDVLDEDGTPSPVGETGELHIGGDGLAREYLGDAEQTAHRFVEHPLLGRVYRTGDLGKWRPDGTLQFLGRADRQVKIRGHRIELGEIEATLDRLAGVRQAVARSVTGPDGRPRLVCHLVPEPGAAPSDADLVAALRAHLPEYMVPSRFVHESALPITANGKVDPNALPNPYLREPKPASVPDTGPLTPWSLETAWSEATGRGLKLQLTVQPGELGPAEALAAASDWARRIQNQLEQARVPHEARLGSSGLVEVLLGAPAETTPPVEASTGQAPTLVSPPSATRAPDPAVQAAIEAVFAELLEIPLIDPDTPFFALGATSLTLVLAHRRLRGEIDASLSVVDLFAHPTVRGLSGCITAHLNAPEVPDLPVAPPLPPEPATGDPAAERRAARARALEVAG
nr:amino acid adenylation domain-containing protein [Kineosporia babensis]